MKLPYGLVACLAVAAFVLGSCGGSGDAASRPAPSPAPGPTGTPPPATPTEATAPTAPAVAAPTNTAAPAPPTPTPAVRQEAAPTQPPPAPTTPASSPAAVVVNLTAVNLAYSISQVRARAGATVTVNFTNRDTAIPHDVTFGPAPGLPHGNTCYGPCEDHYTFAAPAPGTYQFFCSVHADMVGSFIVDP